MDDAPEPRTRRWFGHGPGDGARRALGLVVVLAVLTGLFLWDRRGDDPAPTGTATGTDAPTATLAPDPGTSTGESQPLPPTRPPRKKQERDRGPDLPADDIRIPRPPRGLESLVCRQLTRPVPLVVLSFNIKRGYAGIDRIAAEVARADADVVLMQEVGRIGGSPDQAGQVAQRLDMDWAYGPAVQRPRGVFGNAILSRHDILDSSNTRLPFARGTIPRALLRATIELRGRPVNLYSTHLHYGPNPVQRAQAAAVSRILAADPLPRLVGGDMNAQPGSGAMAALLGPVSDPWPVVGSGAAGTGPRGGRIDYVLPSPELESRRSIVLPTAASDHRIVRTELALPAGDCGA